MGKQKEFNIRGIRDQDIPWIKELMINQWGEERVAVHGDLYIPHELPGFIAINPPGEPIGLVTFFIDSGECEIVTLNSLEQNSGVGSALLSEVIKTAETAGCNRLYLITTNDNITAIEFYQKRGFVLVAIHRGAVDRARNIKPSIPMVSPAGILIKDEIELELSLT